MTQYRYTCGPNTGPWRDTQREAKADAVNAGFGSWDEYSGVAYVDELVVIEER